MALDRPDDDFDDFDRPERQVPGGDVPARRPEPPESRSREEYYEALRVASGGETAGDGGGHRHGTGIPGKTEFPASWDDKKIIDTVVDVARRPDLPPKHQESNDRWVVRGTRDDVE